MLSARRDWWQGLARIAASPFVLLRIPPNTITVAGTLLAVVPALLLYYHDFLWAAVALLLVSALDAVDGAVARTTGRATAFGGYLDSVLDRVSDGVILVGLAAGQNDVRVTVAIGAAFIGQYLTSYARARSYQDATPPAATWNQWFERPERILFLTALFLVIALSRGRVAPEPDLLLWGLSLFAVLSFGAALSRIVRVKRLLGQTHK